jgi:hypothetical protein
MRYRWGYNRWVRSCTEGTYSVFRLAICGLGLRLRPHGKLQCFLCGFEEVGNLCASSWKCTEICSVVRSQVSRFASCLFFSFPRAPWSRDSAYKTDTLPSLHLLTSRLPSGVASVSQLTNQLAYPTSFSMSTFICASLHFSLYSVPFTSLRS